MRLRTNDRCVDTDGVSESNVVGTSGRVALRHTGRRSRTASIVVSDADLVLRLPGVLGRVGWPVPCDQVGIVNLRNVDGAEVADPGIRLLDPVDVPYLATSVDPRGPNIALVFRQPQRVPRLPPIGGSGVLSARQSRSRRGLWLDGVCLRAEDPVQAVITLVGAGAVRVLDPTEWLLDNRPTTSDHEFLAAVDAHQFRKHRLGILVLAAVLLLLGTRWASSQTDAWWPLPVAAACVVGIFGLPYWIKRGERRLARHATTLSAGAGRERDR